MTAPGVVGKLAPVEPVLPVVGGPDQPVVGLVLVLRRRVLGPRQRAVDDLALLHHVARGRARALEPESQVGRQLQVDAAVGVRRGALVIAVPGVAPLCRLAAVVELRLAVEQQLDLAVDAADHPQQHVVGVVVGRRATVRVRAVAAVVPVADQQHVADDDPALAGAPARLQHHRPRQVLARRRTLIPSGPRRNLPASRSRIAPNTLGESTRGRHIHSTAPVGPTSATVSQSDRNA